MRRVLSGCLAGVCLIVAGCSSTGSSPIEPVPAYMPALEGEAEIDAYFARMEQPPASEMLAVPAPPPVMVPPPPPAMDAPSAEDSDTSEAYDEAYDNIIVTGTAVAAPSITNTQEAGVDEGGIVKRRGDHLVILRRGRLFSVSIAGGTLRATDHIDAFPPGEDDLDDAWYDEMLVQGDQVIVIGYSYGSDETELNRFTLSPDGRFTYRDTHYLTSGDYYSSRNYASRLIGDRLLFYTPLDFYRNDWQDDLPTVRKRLVGDEFEDDEAGGVYESRRNDGATRIYLPARFLDKPARGLDTLHTVTECQLASVDLACRSTVVAGAEGRDFYFSPTAAYVWIDAETESQGGNEKPRFIAPAMLYRIPLDGSPPSAIGVSGTPVDQFSFRENEGRSIDILTRMGDGGGGMWGREVSEGAPALLQLPLDALGDGSGDASHERYRELPPVEGWRFFNRFVGRHLLYAGGAYGDEADTPQINIVPLDKPWVIVMPLPHGITRLDAVGSDAVAIGPSVDGALGFSSIRLDAQSGAASLANTYLLPGTEEGENRSQALFYRAEPDSPDGANGMMGLPVGREVRSKAGEFLGDASAIAFLRRQERKLSPAGELASGAVADMEDERDNCLASCVDWYGNARPIFIGDRIFALLGYEIVEGRDDGTRVVERRRLDFNPSARKDARP